VVPVTTDSTPAVIVTGGGTGIGRAIARDHARDHRVLVVGRTESALAETAGDHPGIRTLAIDITTPDAAAVVVATALREFGRLDVLVNNAGAATPAPLSAVDRTTTAEQFAVNLGAPIFLTQAALDALAETRGTVVNISSAGSTGGRAWPGFSVYGAAKAGVEFLTRTWAAELAPRGIRVVAVAPGVVESGMGLRMGSTPEQYAAFLAEVSATTPVGRVAQPEEIAWWVRTLTAPEAGFATGSVFVVDGGMGLG